MFGRKKESQQVEVYTHGTVVRYIKSVGLIQQKTAVGKIFGGHYRVDGDIWYHIEENDGMVRNSPAHSIHRAGSVFEDKQQ